MEDNNEDMANDLRFGTAHVPQDGRRGRGAVTNVAGRYEKQGRVLVDDGWGALDDLPPLRTSVTVDTARSIINRVNSPDISFDRSINPYRGCEHGCIYCFARPSHAYLGLSPGLDFESRLFAKPEAASLLAHELADPKYVCQPIAMGTNTDPYQPIEREWRVTRQILEVLNAQQHPVTIVTKSALVLRDLDILGDMATRNLVRVAVSVTTLDTKLARAMEPRASTPPRRIEAIWQLAAAGVPTTVMTAPMIPALNDMEMETILGAAKEAGAGAAGYVILRLPLEIKDLWREWLEEHYPDRAARVMTLVRAMRGGKDYDANWHQRMTGSGEYAIMIRQRFRLAIRKLGLERRIQPLDTSRFVPPVLPGQQMKLF